MSIAYALEALITSWLNQASDLPEQDETVVDFAGEASEAMSTTLRECAFDLRRVLDANNPEVIRELLVEGDSLLSLARWRKASVQQQDWQMDVDRWTGRVRRITG